MTVELADGSSVAGTVTEQLAVSTDDGSTAYRSTIALDGEVSTDATNVRIVVSTTVADDVLIVPVAALLAPAEGGYAVEIVDGSSTRLVAVDVGAILDGRAEIAATSPKATPWSWPDDERSSNRHAAALELRSVERVYPGNPPVPALAGIDLRVESGEFVAVVGPSGSGKSTLLNVIGTLDRPTAGTMHIAGAEVSALSDRERSGIRAEHLGFVFQQFHLLEGADLVDNVAAGLVYRGCPRRERRRAGTPRARPGRARRTGSPIDRHSCRAASGSGWRSPGRSSVNRRSSWPTSRPATSTR